MQWQGIILRYATTMWQQIAPNMAARQHSVTMWWQGMPQQWDDISYLTWQPDNWSCNTTTMVTESGQLEIEMQKKIGNVFGYNRFMQLFSAYVSHRHCTLALIFLAVIVLQHLCFLSSLIVLWVLILYFSPSIAYTTCSHHALSLILNATTPTIYIEC